jgi:hypothetical protein
MEMSAGVDYAFNPHPSIAQLQRARVQFVCRYISSSAQNDQNGKNLIPGECKALLDGHIKIVVVVEEGASYMLGGHGAGVSAGRHADAVVKALHMPTIPVYIAADWDATPAQQGPINACLDGLASIVGRSRTGIYGGFYVCKRALDAGKAHWAWQTIAWSGGQWDRRAHIRQGLTFSLGGASVDHDQAMFSDFGQWPRPGTAAPAKHDETALHVHQADGKATIGHYAESRNEHVGTFVDQCLHLDPKRAEQFLGRAVPPAGTEFVTRNP